MWSKLKIVYVYIDTDVRCNSRCNLRHKTKFETQVIILTIFF